MDIKDYVECELNNHVFKMKYEIGDIGDCELRLSTPNIYDFAAKIIQGNTICLNDALWLMYYSLRHTGMKKEATDKLYAEMVKKYGIIEAQTNLIKALAISGIFGDADTSVQGNK